MIEFTVRLSEPAVGGLAFFAVVGFICYLLIKRTR